MVLDVETHGDGIYFALSTIDRRKDPTRTHDELLCDPQSARLFWKVRIVTMRSPIGQKMTRKRCQESKTCEKQEKEEKEEES